MTKKTRKRKVEQNLQAKPWTLGNLVFGAMILILLISPYFRGLFFREDYFTVHLLSIVLLLALLVKYFLDKDIYLPNRAVDIILWGLPVAYFLSLFVAADPGLARDELLRNIHYVVIYYILLITMITRVHRYIALNVIVITAVWTALYGYGVAMSTWEFNDAVLWGWSSRIASVYQYPNTLAAILGAGIFISLVMALKTYYKNQELIEVDTIKTTTATALYLAASTLMFSVFILTYSRGAWLVFAVVYGISLLIVPLRDKVPYIVYTAISFVPAMLVYIKANSIMSATFQVNVRNQEMAIPEGGWLVLLGAIATAIVLSAIYSFIHHQSKDNNKKLLISQAATMVVMIVIFTAGMVYVAPSIAPTSEEEPHILQTLINRVETFQSVEEDSSASTRLVFYEDAVKIYKDHPILGAGGGAWNALFEKYQGYSYYSTQAHIYYLQVAAETGTLGIITLTVIVTAFLVTAGLLYWRTRHQNNYLLIAIILAFFMLMGHNFLDFNMSYSAYAVIIWLLMAIVFREAIGLDEKDAGDAFTSKLVALINKPILNNKHHSIALAVLSCIILVANALPAIAHSSLKQANQAMAQGELLIGKIEQAYKLDSKNIDATIRYTAVLNSLGQASQDKAMQNKAIETLTKLEKSAPYSSKTKLALADLHYQNGNINEAIQVLENALEVAPYNPNIYSALIKYSYYLAETNLINNKGKREVEENLQLFAHYYEQKVAVLQELEETGKRGNRPFNITREDMLYQAKANYLQGDYKESLNLLNAAHKDKNLQGETVVWLAACYKKLGDEGNHRKWLKTAVEQNENNKQRIEELIVIEL
ncbi:O-antigen ligase family protein [Desulfofalx alkaliphila]|uniref:O-antigen ligase family protein n=1 Tax=Desulfofalx alkaliphila TaxID=105483 RepID=UPI0004E24B24|nr:O-antigen ligase family protein [Desulfofalx alkaliphila]